MSSDVIGESRKNELYCKRKHPYAPEAGNLLDDPGLYLAFPDYIKRFCKPVIINAFKGYSCYRRYRRTRIMRDNILML